MPDLESKKNKYFSYKKQSKLVQTFPEVCRYSCSKSDEKRTFELYRECYEIEIFSKFHFRVFEVVRIKCTNCGWKAKFPSIFAKKIFKNGLNSYLLLKYAKSRILTSWLLNFFGSVWRGLLIVLGFLIVLTIFDYRSKNIQLTTPKEISISDIFDRTYNGKFIQTSGKADYSLSFYKQTNLVGNENKVIQSEVYFPLFVAANSSDFIVVRIDGAQALNISSKSNTIDYELLKNQNFTVTGKLQSIDKIKNKSLRQFFITDLPQGRGLNAPNLMIDATSPITTRQFADKYIPYYSFLIILVGLSIYIQIYIDKKLHIKRKSS